MLTNYGRELSKEVLSTWGRDGEQKFAYGLVDTPKDVLLGAFVRALQVHREDKQRVQGMGILMQADAEIAYNNQRFATVFSFGRQEIRKGLESESRAFSRRHYVLWRFSETWAIRAGRFMKSYGLNDPNHNLFVRRDLNFSFDSETYNLELSQAGPTSSFFLTYSDGLILNKDWTTLKERGVTSYYSWFLFNKAKLGFNAYHGESETSRRDVAGVWGLVPYKNFFWLTQSDWQKTRTDGVSTKKEGYVTSNRISYEIKQGVLPFLLVERKKLNRAQDLSEQESLGLGLQWFPRPHWEILAAAQRGRVVTSGDQSDLLWLMVHFYL